MSTGGSPDLDPFLQRSSVEIAADVGAAAMRLLHEAAFVVPMVLGYVTGGDSEQADGASEGLPTNLLVLADEINALGGIFDKVTGWWIASAPPACDPKSRSAVEALLRESIHLQACFDEPGLSDIRSRCAYAEILRRRIEDTELEFEAAISCEVTTMAERRPPEASLLSLWARVLPDAGLITFKYLKSAASYEVSSRLPTEWRRMSQDDRVAAVGRMWERLGARAGIAPPVRRRAPDTPAQARILKLLDGRAMKQIQLARELGVHESQLHRPGYLFELKAADRVRNDRKIGGYYRPDEPPTTDRPHLDE